MIYSNYQTIGLQSFNTTEAYITTCQIQKNIGYVLIIFLVVSLICNILILIAFYRKKRKLNFEYVIIAIAILNLLGNGS